MERHPSNVPFPELLDHLVGNQDQNTDQGHRSQRFPHRFYLPSVIGSAGAAPEACARSPTLSSYGADGCICSDGKRVRIEGERELTAGAEKYGTE